jgi:hypothetical protein
MGPASQPAPTPTTGPSTRYPSAGTSRSRRSGGAKRDATNTGDHRASRHPSSRHLSLNFNARPRTTTSGCPRYNAGTAAFASAAVLASAAGQNCWSGHNRPSERGIAVCPIASLRAGLRPFGRDLRPRPVRPGVLRLRRRMERSQRAGYRWGNAGLRRDL